MKIVSDKGRFIPVRIRKKMKEKTIFGMISFMWKIKQPLRKASIFLLSLLVLPVLLMVRCADAYWNTNFQEADSPAVDTMKTDDSGKNDTGGEIKLTVAPVLLTVSSEIAEIIQNNRDNLFPISLVKNIFSEQVDEVLSHVGENSIMRIVTEYGQQDIDLFVNTDSIHDLFGKINFDGEYPENFEISVNVTVRDVYPKKRGGCFVGFTDNGMTKSPDTDEFLFVFDGNSGMFYNKKGGNDAGEVLFEEPLSEKTARITISHLTGHTFVFINDICVGQYHDGKYAPFRISYGVMTFADGKTACCSFDDLDIRKFGN